MKRGDFWIVNLEPGYGKEMRKKRPGLIISGDSFNNIAHYVIVIPTTSIVPSILSEEMVDLGKPKSFDKKSVLLPLYIRNIDKERLVKKIGKISPKKLRETEEKLKMVLELN